MFFIALFVSGFVSLASAQRFPISFNTSQKITHGYRFIKGISLQPKYSSTLYGAKQEVTINEGIYYNSESERNLGNYNVYNNVSSQSFTIKAGQTVQPNFTTHLHWDGNWMHSYVYVDENRDGTLTTSSPNELKVYTSGENANSSWVNHIGTFRAPTTPGTYPMRFKIDWNSTLPQGGSQVVSAGGSITDVDITLVRPTVRFSYNSNYVTVTPTTAAENLVCGENYTFTITPNANCQINSVVAHIGDESVFQNVTLTPNNGTYTVPASQFQNDMVITINATKTSTFTAAQAAQGECYFLLKNRSYSSRYLKVGITPNSGASDRFTYESPYLFTHTLTQNRSDKDIASYIWRLTPAPTNGKYYMKGQGLALGAIANGGNKCVPLQESGAELTIASSGGYYTLTTGAGDNGYLHAIDFGQTRQDGHFPNNAEGDFVVAWSSSETPSQWTIEPIECFSVTIGAGGWSSFNYAFPIAFAANEVSNVYISTSENTGVVTLVPLTAIDGLISVPSNTPIFVEGVAGNVCTVELLTTEPAAVGPNTLRGTTLPQTATLTSGETAYVIATPSGKETALYRLGADVKIPVNKAYYVSSQSQTSKLGMNFGEVTEISNAVTAQPALKDEILYDLRGHRVVYPTHGIYVTGSGRKIFIK